MSEARERVWHWILCACLGLGLTLGCARQAGPPNLLLITLDTTRRDHCSVYGYERETTPNLERIAAEGVRLALAYAPSSTTAPSHATLFTSLHPITHRVSRNGRVLSPAYQTLAERMRERGWTTAGFVGSYVLADRFGLGQGFEVWDDEFDPATATTRRAGRGREFEPGVVDGQAVAGEKFGVRLGDFKLVLGPEEGTRELFDVLHDPRERENLAAAEPARAAELEKRIADWLAENKRGVTAPDATSQEDLERLRALGYVK